MFNYFPFCIYFFTQSDLQNFLTFDLTSNSKKNIDINMYEIDCLAQRKGAKMNPCNQ